MFLRCAYIFLLIVACGGGAKKSTLPTKPADAIPADDLSIAKKDVAPVDEKDAGLVAKDPRVVVRTSNTSAAGMARVLARKRRRFRLTQVVSHRFARSRESMRTRS